jgi:hypothetical protein
MLARVVAELASMKYDPSIPTDHLVEVHTNLYVCGTRPQGMIAGGVRVAQRHRGRSARAAARVQASDPRGGDTVADRCRGRSAL